MSRSVMQEAKWLYSCNWTRSTQSVLLAKSYCLGEVGYRMDYMFLSNSICLTSQFTYCRWCTTVRTGLTGDIQLKARHLRIDNTGVLFRTWLFLPTLLQDFHNILFSPLQWCWLQIVHLRTNYELICCWWLHFNVFNIGLYITFIHPEYCIKFWCIMYDTDLSVGVDIAIITNILPILFDIVDLQHYRLILILKSEILNLFHLLC